MKGFQSEDINPISVREGGGDQGSGGKGKRGGARHGFIMIDDILH